METIIQLDHSLFHDFYSRIQNFLFQDQVTYCIDGEIVHGYRSPDCNAIWIRDHSDILRGARYFEKDMTSAITHFATTQQKNGSLFDFVSCAMDRENWTKYVRVPVEADVEFRFVKALYLAWQSSGDDKWLNEMLPAAEKALHYITTHPWRWDSKHGLVKRAFTIDTWDFDFVATDQPWLNFQITDRTHWGVFHGDNSGYYEAFQLIAKLYERIKNSDRAGYWQKMAGQIQQRLNRLAWNGRFYTHRIPLDDFRFPGVDEAGQLSFSNPIAINRGVTTHEMAVAMLNEYKQRKKATNAFAEWFSIEPPFPAGSFGDSKLVRGAYINGGIFPLVGGELARAAFEHGDEAYGVAILAQYAQMIQERNATYLWYFPNGQPSTIETSTSPDATPTDGWGSSAMLYAFIEGLAGVVDVRCKFQQIRLSPRWAAAGISQALVQVGYGASGAGIRYDYHLDNEAIELNLEGSAQIQLHLLLSPQQNVQRVTFNDKSIQFAQRYIENSRYLDANFRLDGKGEMRIWLSKKQT
ncbi:hypothetical protein JW964_20440 [candidate division KSB1 bacterium]|nr:hypothetical protein [candidate division KSB1 bacterium]